MDNRRSRLDWTWLLIALCAFALVLIVSQEISTFDGQMRFWDVGRYYTGEPFVLGASEPRPNGAAAKAGIQKGDRFDLRDQTPAARAAFQLGPRGEPLELIARRNGRSIKIQFIGSTVWEGASLPKLLLRIVPDVAGLCFVACALLIVARRGSKIEGRWLALVLTLLALGSAFPFPFAGKVLVLLTNPAIPLAVLVALSSRFGARSNWRTMAEWATYAAAFARVAMDTIGWYGWLTGRINPLPLVAGYSLQSTWLTYALGLLALITVIGAVWSTRQNERARAGWLLLPLTLAQSFAIFVLYLQNLAPSWILYTTCYVLSSAFLLLGAFFVTYALLRRRVIDIGFVLSRTIVVAVLSLVVVIAFVLLEWAFGTILAGASHATGLFANAALALVLGLSMRYIHKRVDVFVDSVMFRKRHEDERALRAFAKEAAFVTDPEALFDLAIAIVRDHTNATGAALYVNGSDEYRSVRAFGNVPVSAGENDPAILALKAWHEPIDPHRYKTALTGDLAVPVVARGQLHGVLLFEQRASGEAYAPDEIEAFAEFAHGIGSAYDALARNSDETNATVAAISELLERRFGPLQ